ncbi:hypothetical protein ABK040_011714 [Willaertia magna]
MFSQYQSKVDDDGFNETEEKIFNLKILEKEEHQIPKEGIEIKINENKKERISFIKLLVATFCFAGLQFGWAIQYARLTPFTLEIGLPKYLVTLVWLCGPISGLLVQPVVGFLSDRTTFRFGRRRLYLLIGAICICLAMLLIGFCLDIGKLLGDKGSGNNPAALAFAVIGFWLLDVSNNMMQMPSRALVADIAAEDQQELGNAILTFWTGFGNTLGYTAGFIEWSSYTTTLETDVCREPCNNLKMCFLISMGFLIFSLIVTMIVAKEKPWTKESAEEKGEKTFLINELELENNQEVVEEQTEKKPQLSKIEKIKALLLKLIAIIKLVPISMWKLCVVNFFAWIGWFSYFVFITDLVGVYVFHGSTNDPDSPLYQRYEAGIRYGSFGLAGFSITAGVFSFIISWASSRYGLKLIYGLGNLSLAILLISTYWVSDKYVAVAVISLFGIPSAVTNVIPFGLTANYADDDKKGIFMGLLNIFIVIPQLVLSAISPLIQLMFNGDIRAVLIFGGICAFISSLLTWIVKVPKSMTEKKKKKKKKKNQKGKNTTSTVIF